MPSAKKGGNMKSKTLFNGILMVVIAVWTDNHWLPKPKRERRDYRRLLM